jgi:hypothetical protein
LSACRQISHSNLRFDLHCSLSFRFFEPVNEKGVPGKGYTHIRPGIYTEKQLIEIIDVIRNATQCLSWKQWVLEEFKRTHTVPPYLRAFHTIVSASGEDNDSEVLPFIQRHILDVSIPNVINMRKTMITNGSQDVGWNMDNTASEKLKHKKEPRRDDIAKCTSQITPLASWSVLSLFVHSAICQINKLEDKPEYVFWPTASPKVNNRKVQLALIKGESGFVEKMGSQQVNWTVQSAHILPYCVGRKPDGTDPIYLSTMIASTEQATSKQFNVSDETESNEGLSCFTDELVAGQLDFDEAKKLFKALSRHELPESNEFENMSNGMCAFVVVNFCLDFLNRAFNGLEKVDDWCNLYAHLLMNDENKMNMEERIMHPTTANDLVHKTRMLLMSKHTIRFSFIEGQKRATSTVHALMGFKPQDSFIFHGNRDRNDAVIGGETNLFNKDVDLWSEDLFDGTNAHNGQFMFRNAGMKHRPVIYQFLTENHDLNKLVIDTCVAYSTSLVQEGNKEEKRSWQHIVQFLCAHDKVHETLELCPVNVNTWPNHELLIQFIMNFRKLILNLLFQNERESKSFLADCSHNDLMEAISDQNAEKFVDTIIFAKSKNNLPSTVMKAHLKAYGFDLGAPPPPKLCHATIMVMLYVAFGNLDGLGLIQNVGDLNGKRSTRNKLNVDLVFEDLEPQYIEKVSQGL